MKAGQADLFAQAGGDAGLLPRSRPTNVQTQDLAPQALTAWQIFGVKA